MKKIINFLRKAIDIIVFLLTFGGDISDKAVDDGVLDFSGQGRDSKYRR